jgi:Uma2 family endonuclease
MATASQPKLMTAEELMAADLGEGCDERVRGKVVDVPPAMPEHGRVCVNVSFLHAVLGRKTGFGYTLANDTAVVTERDPDTVRGPDVCFDTDARWPGFQVGKSLPPVAPGVAVEAGSPGSRRGEIARKVSEILAIDTQQVWFVYPASRSKSIHRSDNEPPRVLHHGAVVEDLPELPGFRCSVPDCFIGVRDGIRTTVP